MRMIETNHCVDIAARDTLESMEAALTFETDVEERQDAPLVVRRLSYLSSSEVAECTCPEWCERDHDRD